MSTPGMIRRTHSSYVPDTVADFYEWISRNPSVESESENKYMALTEIRNDRKMNTQPIVTS